MRTRFWTWQGTASAPMVFEAAACGVAIASFDDPSDSESAPADVETRGEWRQAELAQHRQEVETLKVIGSERHTKANVPGGFYTR